MTKPIIQSMYDYYDERALEYEQVYKTGTGPTTISDPHAYIEETAVVSKLVKKHCKGKLIDIACGTAFWLPYYAKKCSEILLIDQSENMLKQAEKKVNSLGIKNKSQLISDNIFNHTFDNNYFDSALIGFFIGHFIERSENKFFNILKTILKESGVFIIVDSIWSEERRKIRKKAGIQTRILNNGRPFDIYKKYFTEQDIIKLSNKYHFKADILHQGRTFICFKGSL